MDPYKQLKSLGLWLGLILIGLGLVLLIWPEKIIGFIAIIIGIGVLLFGLVKGISLARNWKNSSNNIHKTALVILLLGLGIYVLVNTNVTTTAIGFCIGIFAIITALDRFSVAIERKRLGFKIGTTILFGIINLAFGVGVILSSVYVMSFVLMLVGIYLIVEGIMIIVSSRILLDL